MNGGAEIPLAVILFVQVPLLLIWAFVIWDIVRQPQMPVARKLLWALACSIVFPVQIVYLLVRPQRGRAERVADRDDNHATLVDAVLDREAGRLAPAEFSSIVTALRHGPTAPGPIGPGKAEQ